MPFEVRVNVRMCSSSLMVALALSLCVFFCVSYFNPFRFSSRLLASTPLAFSRRPAACFFDAYVVWSQTANSKDDAAK